MEENYFLQISKEIGAGVAQIAAVAKLLSEGATVPFIARYRKEATGSLDEVQIAKIRDEMARLAEVDARRASIKSSLKERNILTAELETAIDNAQTLTVLEDIYQPFRPKRRTRATIAKEKGLQALADFIFENQNGGFAEMLNDFISEEKGVKDADEALAGARDIIAEFVSDNAEARAQIRKIYEEDSILSSKVLSGKEEEGAKYRDYFDWQEASKSAPSHRVLAIRRGEKEGILSMRISSDEDVCVGALKKIFVNGSGDNAKQIELAVEDSFKRLLSSSTETHVRLLIKKRADDEAIKIFATNLRELLMSPPLGRKNVLAIDPGFRTGCKVVCLNRQGELLHNDLIYIAQSDLRGKEASMKILGLCARFQIEAIAIGNGTAGRETEAFVKTLGLPKTIPVVMVNESGASIYSASEVAREEFPEQDITVRGAVSIGRRLMDPLSELVKIDPQSVGVGQYQHDVNDVLLKKSLDDVVVSCVNSVGVEVNTASKQLLSYVSGLNPSTAANLIAYRAQNGAIKSRRELLKVKGFGEKTFEQAAAFLRIRDSENPLDSSGVHPERYALVEKMADDLKTDLGSLVKNRQLQEKIDLKAYVSDEVGMPTLMDIKSELGKPGLDPRDEFEAFSFADGVNSIDDLKEGMRLAGIVTNVTAFGAFVDIGVHQDGLVHISELSDTFVRDPNEAVRPQQKVNVVVLEVDKSRKRIALSMKSNPEARAKSAGDIARKNSPNTSSRKFGERKFGQQNGGGFRDPRRENGNRGGGSFNSLGDFF